MTQPRQRGMHAFGAKGNRRMSQLGLLASARFLPLFLTQGLGALNDNIFRNALIVLVTYRIAENAPLPPAQLAAVATGLFILPYFLFSALAGQLADRFEKSLIIRRVKLAEIFCAVFAAVAFAMNDTSLLLLILFCFGIQSAFFSPVKFAVLPQHLQERELISGNGFLQLVSFMAILVGSILGAALITGPGGATVVSVLLIVTALTGYMTALAVPHAAASAPGMALKFNLAAETIKLLKFANQNDAVFWGIIGIAWFWMMGGLYVTQLAPFTKFAVGGDESVVTWFLAVFTIGVGVGALLCNRLLASVISPRFVFLSAIGLSVCATDLWLATMNAAVTEELIGLGEFLRQPRSWRLSIALFCLAAFAGIYSVPLYALVQARSDKAVRARTIAAGNIVIALFMVAGAVTTMLLLAQGLSVPQVFALGAAANVVGALVIHRQLAAAG